MVDLKKFLDVDKLKSALGKKTESTDDKTDPGVPAIESLDVPQEESAKQSLPFFKDKKKIIRLLIVLLIGYLIIDQFVLTDNSDSEDPLKNVPATPIKKNKNKHKRNAVTATETMTATSSETASASPSQTPLAIETPPSEPTPLPTEIPVAPTPVIEETPAPSLAPEATAAPEVLSTPETSSNLGEGEVKTPAKKDLGSQLTSAVGGDSTNSAPKKMEVTQYVSPPDYSVLGRGLVYNCKGKHWACVEKDSYLACKQNEIWQKDHGKLPECSARNVYSSIDDCKIIQTHMINTAQKTDFCK